MTKKENKTSNKEKIQDKNKNIHPENNKIIIKCECGAETEVLSVKKEIKVEICSQCHPFYTGQAKTVDTAGRVEKFKKRFASKV